MQTKYPPHPASPDWKAWVFPAQQHRLSYRLPSNLRPPHDSRFQEELHRLFMRRPDSVEDDNPGDYNGRYNSIDGSAPWPGWHRYRPGPTFSPILLLGSATIRSGPQDGSR